MWSLEVNNVTIPLPNDADTFLVSKKDGGLISTDMDIYLNALQMEALGIRGVLEYENGYRYESVPIEGLLNNIQKIEGSLPCTVTINKFSITLSKVNITIEAEGYNTDIKFNDLYENWVSYQRSHGGYTRPLYGLTRDRQDQTQKMLYTGYRLSGIDYACCPTPNVDKTMFYNVFNYLYNGSVPAMTDFEYSNISPNTIYMNGEIKMRRGSVKREFQAENYCVKGDYAGLREDTLGTDFTITGANPNYGSFAGIDANYTMRTISSVPQRKTRIYFTGVHATLQGATSKLKIKITNYGQPIDFEVVINNTSIYYGTIATQGVQIIDRNPDTSLIEVPFSDNVLGKNYIEITSPTFDVLNYELKWNFSYVYGTNVLSAFYWDFQQHWDDDFVGIKKLVGQDGDTTLSNYYVNYDDQVIMTTKHFDSRAWGASFWSDYDGHINTSGITDSFYHETDYNIDYNGFMPLMYVDPNDCVDAYMTDIFTNMGYIKGKFVNAHDGRVSYETDVYVYPYVLEDYYAGEEFDTEIKGAGIGYIDDDVIVGDPNNAEIFARYKFINTVLNTTYWKTHRNSVVEIEPDNILVFPQLRDGDDRFPDDARQKAYDRMLFHSFKKLQSGTWSAISPERRDLYVYQINGEGYALWSWPAGAGFDDTYIEYATDIAVITENPKIITCRVTVVGWITSSYIVFQTRTWRILSQQLNSDGTNELTLLLYY